MKSCIALWRMLRISWGPKIYLQYVEPWFIHYSQYRIWPLCSVGHLSSQGWIACCSKHICISSSSLSREAAQASSWRAYSPTCPSFPSRHWVGPETLSWPSHGWSESWCTPCLPELWKSLQYARQRSLSTPWPACQSWESQQISKL